ncbi:hypothetical protein, partial [Nocardioides malaquae]|uniref:hypothetical protein n=1 Tax=Nocardioides malaquae TaxID=2773426 RepID=UPI001D0D3C32
QGATQYCPPLASTPGPFHDDDRRGCDAGDHSATAACAHESSQTLDDDEFEGWYDGEYYGDDDDSFKPVRSVCSTRGDD